ncbi:MAG: hypothetical protein R3F31_00900 [Verrucomicrobiales bacterium]
MLSRQAITPTQAISLIEAAGNPEFLAVILVALAFPPGTGVAGQAKPRNPNRRHGFRRENPTPPRP